MKCGDYIHDNTDDEITHHQFLNAYLVSRGAPPAILNRFRTLMGSTATGVNRGKIGHRLTNLTRLLIDTSWWTRYRDDSHNPDLDPNHVFPQAVPTLAINRHTAMPAAASDPSNFEARFFSFTKMLFAELSPIPLTVRNIAG